MFSIALDSHSLLGKEKARPVGVSMNFQSCGVGSGRPPSNLQSPSHQIRHCWWVVGVAGRGATNGNKHGGSGSLTCHSYQRRKKKLLLYT